MANKRLVSRAVGTIQFGGISGTYATIQSSVQGRGVIVVIVNSLNTSTIVSLDGGTTDFIELPAATSLSLDLGANGAEFSGTISVKQGAAGAPASGFISCGVIRTQ